MHRDALEEAPPEEASRSTNGCIMVTGASLLAATALIAVVAGAFASPPSSPSLLLSSYPHALQNSAASSPHRSHLLTSLDEAPTDIAKMKAAVHAAAQIKKSAISTAHLPGTSASSTAAAAASFTGPRGRVKATDPAWFKAGPFVIASVLVAICGTFTYCAFSSTPTSMSGKYDLSGKGGGRGRMR
mmetsp:Transcript_3158/g.8049  ORF Transcript_3158/g.8049 Transcript_3158/m.8049 type:complete len:186 (-) Transcript_3158:169-726(-)